MITSLETVIEEKDVKLDQVGKLAESFECFQRRVLTLEEDKRNRRGMHDGAVQAQQMTIQIQQKKIKKLEEEQQVTVTTENSAITPCESMVYHGARENPGPFTAYTQYYMVMI